MIKQIFFKFYILLYLNYHFILLDLSINNFTHAIFAYSINKINSIHYYGYFKPKLKIN